MAKGRFLPVSDLNKEVWLKSFAAGLPASADKYGIKPSEVKDMQAASIYYSWFIGFFYELDKYKKSITTHKKVLKDIPVSGPVPMITAPPIIVDMPPPVPPGIFKRALSIASRIKAHISYTESDGRGIGIEGPEITIDLNTVKPKFKIHLSRGGHPEIAWKKKGMQAIEIYKKDAEGKWFLLAIDSHPNYLDISPLPPYGQAVVWFYRCIYRHNDEIAGQWSNEVSISVQGG